MNTYIRSLVLVSLISHTSPFVSAEDLASHTDQLVEDEAEFTAASVKATTFADRNAAVWQQDDGTAPGMYRGLDLTSIQGDIDGDGNITLSDAIVSLQVSVGLTVVPKPAADVNGDNRIGTAETIHALRFLSNISDLSALMLKSYGVYTGQVTGDWTGTATFVLSIDPYIEDYSVEGISSGYTWWGNLTTPTYADSQAIEGYTYICYFDFMVDFYLNDIYQGIRQNEIWIYVDLLELSIGNWVITYKQRDADGTRTGDFILQGDPGKTTSTASLPLMQPRRAAELSQSHEVSGSIHRIGPHR